jgi:hypothetical protein
MKSRGIERGPRKQSPVSGCFGSVKSLWATAASASGSSRPTADGHAVEMLAAKLPLDRLSSRAAVGVNLPRPVLRLPT